MPQVNEFSWFMLSLNLLGLFFISLIFVNYFYSALFLESKRNSIKIYYLFINV